MYAWFALLTLAFGAAVTFLYAFGGVSNTDSTAWTLLFINGVLALSMLTYGLAKVPLGFYSIFYYFVAFFCVLIPAIWLITDDWPYASTYGAYPVGLFSYAQLCILVASVSFGVAYSITTASPLTMSSQSKYYSGWKLRGNHLIYLLAYCCLLAAIYISLGGSIIDAAFRSETLEGAGVGQLGATRQRIAGDALGLLRRATLFSAVLLFLEYRRTRASDGGRTAKLSIVLLAGILLNLPMSVPRGWLLAVVFVILSLIASSLQVRAWGFLIVMVFGLYVSSVIDIFKRQYWITNDSLTFDKSYFLQGHFQSFDTFMSQILVASDRGYDWGMNFVGMIFMHIPRSMWSDKPLSPSLQLASEYYYQNYNWYHNVGASSIGSFYLDFGLIGVVAFGSILGALSKKLDPMLTINIGAYVASSADCLRRNGAALTLAPFCVGGSIVFLRGSTWVGYNFYLTSIISFFAVWMVLFRRETFRRSDDA